MAACVSDHSRGCERIPLELRQRHPSRAVASRQCSRNSGGRPRLAAEIPDIFLPLARNENSGMTSVFLTSSVPPTPPQIGGVESAARGDHRSGHAAPCHHGSGWHEGGWFLFFLWRLLRCRRGILSRAIPWSSACFRNICPNNGNEARQNLIHAGLAALAFIWA